MSTVELLLLLLLRLLLELLRLELWATAPILWLLWPTQLTPSWDIHHVVLGRSTVELPLPAGLGIIFFLFFSSTSTTTFIILLINGHTHQLIV
jgi:hypothetical protein